MKRPLPFALLVALLTAGCAASGATGAVPPLAAGQDAVDAEATDLAAADAPAADSAPADVAASDAEPGDAQPADLQTADASADAAKPLPATKGLQLEPLALPEFSQVVDSSGQPVSKAQLLGHYTVLWFYPAASTGG